VIEYLRDTKNINGMTFLPMCRLYQCKQMKVTYLNGKRKTIKWMSDTNSVVETTDNTEKTYSFGKGKKLEKSIREIIEYKVQHPEAIIQYI